MSEVAAPVVEPKAKTPKGKSPKAKATKPKVKPSHPGFNAMVEDAIRHLKERTGSSLAAIKKVIGDKHSKELPAHWEKHVTMAIRRLADGGKLVKVKGSFKLGEELKKAPKKKPTISKPKKTTSDEPKVVKKATVKKPKAEKKAPASAKKSKTDKPKVKKAAAPKTKKVAAASKPKAEKKPKATTPKPKKAVAVKKPAGVKKVKAAPKPKVVKASKATKA